MEREEETIDLGKLFALLWIGKNSLEASWQDLLCWHW